MAFIYYITTSSGVYRFKVSHGMQAARVVVNKLLGHDVFLVFVVDSEPCQY